MAAPSTGTRRGLPAIAARHGSRALLSRWLVLVLGGLLLGYAVNALFHPGDHALDELFANWVHCSLLFAGAILCLARAINKQEERAAWLLLGTGLVFWAIGETYWALFFADAK